MLRLRYDHNEERLPRAWNQRLALSQKHPNEDEDTVTTAPSPSRQQKQCSLPKVPVNVDIVDHFLRYSCVPAWQHLPPLACRPPQTSARCVLSRLLPMLPFQEAAAVSRGSEEERCDFSKCGIQSPVASAATSQVNEPSQSRLAIASILN